MQGRRRAWSLYVYLLLGIMAGSGCTLMRSPTDISLAGVIRVPAIDPGSWKAGGVFVAFAGVAFARGADAVDGGAFFAGALPAGAFAEAFRSAGLAPLDSEGSLATVDFLAAALPAVLAGAATTFLAGAFLAGVGAIVRASSEGAGRGNVRWYRSGPGAPQHLRPDQRVPVVAATSMLRG